MLSTIDAVLISQLRLGGDVSLRARDLLARYKVLWTTYPLGVLLRVQNRLRKMIRKICTTKLSADGVRPNM